MDNLLQNSILNGLYDDQVPAQQELTPQLLTNNKIDNLWFELRRSLESCRSFTWSVAFISPDILTPFKLVMQDLARKQIKGTLITGAYLGFNDPKVFDELAKIPNLEVRISKQEGFHAKGYYFDQGDHQEIIIGSANFTRSALLVNSELALKVASSQNANLTKQLKAQLNSALTNSFELNKTWLDEYRANWVKPRTNASFIKASKKVIHPNQMQKAALKQLEALVKNKQKRGLVVSATGTGKTYLGAFAVKEYKPKRFLYIVHRQQIAKKSMASFKHVIGAKDDEFGMLTGKKQDLDKKYLFATVQTLSQKQNLEKFEPDAFDYILIDEAHRAAAPSYQKVLNYFKPEFWLGMTATPERMDKQDVYRIFDYNLAYEIRLKAALQENMLTPFHYISVQDYEKDGESIDETSDLRFLTDEKRVAYILKELDYYGYCGKQARGLVFCSRRQEAQTLAKMFSQKGHLAKALTNDDSETKRQKVVQELEEGKIEYIFTVDLFNEGIDIPSLNQIVMLRNTQSSIVFIQQLGRGLRKYPGKDFTTVIDFIGNYKNNYLIPLALNHDTTRLREQAIREVKIPQLLGVSTINFSQVASEKILNSLEKIKLDSMIQLRESYQELKQKLGRVPLLIDFLHYGSTSPEVFINNSSFKNYGDFLLKMGEEVELTSYAHQVLTFLTKELALGKRVHELILLKSLAVKKPVSQDEYVKLLQKQGAYINDEVIESVENFLNLDFFNVKTGKTTKKAQYGDQSLIEKNLFGYELSSNLSQLLTNEQFKRLFFDCIDVGLELSKNYDQKELFTLYQRYDRKDVCHLLNWKLDVSAPMYGYRVDEQTPIFITYHNEDLQKRSSVYNNQLQDGRVMRWYTRSPRRLDSPEVKKLLSPEMPIFVFVKRSDSDGKGFYYLGQAKIDRSSVKQEKVGLKGKDAVGMDLVLKHELTHQMRDILFIE
ncbi:DEAD/DEAH box helicase [uncultured Lactobacillus sp.]|uniref:DEAD/DEAH box helicase n=1 Tax=uncultured Lactobacillus sp. TaxID=153152 RepID=UPI0026317649|nr:DEAD/DEAH box helicase [uncultured Lactobacillus sp.]